MKFVIAMMLAGAVLAFAGVAEAFAQQAPPIANDYTVRTDKGPDDITGKSASEAAGKIQLNMTGLGIIEDPDGDLNDASITIISTTGDAAGFAHSVTDGPWFVMTAFYTEADAGLTQVIEYQITDSDDLSAKGEITVNVHPLVGKGNPAPVFATIPPFTMVEGGALEVDVNPYITDDDSEVELRIEFSHDDNPRFNQGGTFQEIGNNTIIYQAPEEIPDDRRSVIEQIFVTIYDDIERAGDTTVGSLRFAIFQNQTTPTPTPTPTNTAPTASNGQASAQTGQTISIALADLIADAEDADSALSISISTQPASGSASVSGTNISYTASAAGSFTIGYTVTDTGSLTATGTITVTVTAPVATNTPPTISVPPTASTLEAGSSVTIPLTVNDAQDPISALRIAVTTQPAVGSAVISGTDIVYTAPEDAAAGTYTIGVTVTDSEGLSATANPEVIIVEGNTVAIRACTR